MWIDRLIIPLLSLLVVIFIVLVGVIISGALLPKVIHKTPSGFEYTREPGGVLCAEYISTRVGLQEIKGRVCVDHTGQIDNRGGRNMSELYAKTYYLPVLDSLFYLQGLERL